MTGELGKVPGNTALEECLTCLTEALGVINVEFQNLGGGFPVGINCFNAEVLEPDLFYKLCHDLALLNIGERWF